MLHLQTIWISTTRSRGFELVLLLILAFEPFFIYVLIDSQLASLLLQSQEDQGIFCATCAPEVLRGICYLHSLVVLLVSYIHL